MAKIAYFLASSLLVCVTPGKHATANSPAVPPELKTLPLGPLSDEDRKLIDDKSFQQYLDAGTIYKGEGAGEDTTAADQEAARREALTAEAKLLGLRVSGNIGLDTLESKVIEARNKRPADGTQPSIQDGAGRADPSEGNDGEGGAPAAGDNDLIG